MLPDCFPESLLKASRKLSLKKGESLFQQDDRVDSLFYIIEGEVIALRYQQDGKPAIMMRNTSGEMFAPASMNMSSYPCSAVAVLPSSLLQISVPVFQTHLQNNHKFASFYIQSLADNLKRQCARSERLRLKSAKQRVLHYISCESPSGTEITLSCPTSKWAEELGIEPESLYRTLAEMEKEGVIERDKRCIRITCNASIAKRDNNH